ncbi:MAG: hypothetical protein QCH99_08335 [Candidatus Bathyarchaeota archaeon]|nr:hypothetical protein [Candidatus Bathyarchaeum tardum]
MSMRRILATVFSITAILVVLFILNQAGNIGIPWEFNLLIIASIGIIIIGLIRTWLRP